MSDSEGFEPTLAKLRADRDAVERRLNERIEDLDARVRAARASAGVAEEVAAAAADEDSGADAEGTSTVPAPGAPDQDPWAAASGWRRLLAAPLRWLLHDYIGTLDARHEAVARALQERDRRLDAVAAALAEEVQRLRDRQQRQRSQVESVRELATRCVEVLERVPEVVLDSRSLLNAKEAETVQVATEGVRARTGLLLEELSRQQEALLAELVGRRREIDELLEQIRERGAEA